MRGSWPDLLSHIIYSSQTKQSYLVDPLDCIAYLTVANYQERVMILKNERWLIFLEYKEFL